MRPNPAGRGGAPLALDGDEPCSSPPDWMASRSTRPGSRRSHRAFGAGLPGACSRSRSRRASIRRPTPSSWGFIVRARPIAMRGEGFRRIAYFLDRPDSVPSTYRVRLEADRGEAPVLLSNGNLEASGEVEHAWPSLRHLARSALEAVEIGSRAYAGDLSRVRILLQPHVGQDRRARDLCRAWSRGARALRDGRSQALDGLGRNRFTGAVRSRRSTSSPSPISIWARWRTRASTSSTTNMSLRRLILRPTTIIPTSKA